MVLQPDWRLRTRPSRPIRGLPLTIRGSGPGRLHGLPRPRRRLPLHQLSGLLMRRGRRLRRTRLRHRRRGHRRRRRLGRRLRRRTRGTRLRLGRPRLHGPPRPALLRRLRGRLHTPGHRRGRRRRPGHGFTGLRRTTVPLGPLRPMEPCTAPTHPRPPVGRLAAPMPRRMRRRGPVPVVTHAHTSGGRGDGHDRGGQTDGYVQGAHGQPPPRAGRGVPLPNSPRPQEDTRTPRATGGTGRTSPVPAPARPTVTHNRAHAAERRRSRNDGRSALGDHRVRKCR